MKIKTKQASYNEALSKLKKDTCRPKRPGVFFRTLIRVLSAAELKEVKFKHKEIGMEKLAPRQPCLVLMNHSSFIDLKIASQILKRRPYNIVCTSDGFVGKEWLMRRIGCIPTKKFVTELSLVRDMQYALKTLRCSVLMFPEASYTFDGTATPLPESLGKCVKLLGVPVVMIRTFGAFARDPLYNNLQTRKVDVSAEAEYILSPEEIAKKSADEINGILKEQFSFDNFKWQQTNRVIVNEAFRADFLNRVLYKCPNCGAEGKMQGRGVTLCCNACKKEYTLTEEGHMRALDGETEFSHVPDWYAWERACVKKEIENGTYRLDVPVDIGVMVNMKAIYMVGKGRLVHTADGFCLTGCDGQINYSQKPQSSYGLYADYNWYEIGDMICIGNSEILYYCFPQNGEDVVAKTRLAAEELYKMKKRRNSTGA